MSALDIFEYSGQQVRTVILDGEPVFVAKDVCDVLGIVKYRDAIAQLDTDERVSVAVDTPGGAQQMTAVTESGIYGLALISRSPAVKPFMRWVTHDILPAIRKTGTYSVAQVEETPELLIARALTVATGMLEQKDAQIAVLAPKAVAYERFLDSTSLIKIEVAARQAGLGRTTAYQLLRKAHIIQKLNKSPMQSYAHRFHEVASTHENSSGDLITDYTTKVKPEHFDWLVATLERLASEENRATA